MNERLLAAIRIQLANARIKPNSLSYQAPPDELIRDTLKRKEGTLTDRGALVIQTGAFTGRSPKDRFIVRDAITQSTVDWNHYNIPMDYNHYECLYEKMVAYLSGKSIWVRDAFVCADERYRIPLRVITETPWASLFAYNMFLRPEVEELEGFMPEWTLIHAPGFTATPETDGTRQANFTIIDFFQKVILIGGTAYTGEIKKAVFTILNYLLPKEKGVLPMHCAANYDATHGVALFFGLSGTGKTTLSADPGRTLIGDDEHGWSGEGVFNFEGGCYAKCIHLTREQEPQIYGAIRKGALLENTVYVKGSNRVDFNDASITENTRVSYPLSFIPNALLPSVAGIPKHIFFLSCDAHGVLPPISRLNAEKVMEQFLLGYTAKVAGTEAGVKEPQTTFSSCFGAPFLPLSYRTYALLLQKKIRKHGVRTWLVNTGWIGGPYGRGERIALPYTRLLIQEAMSGALCGIAHKTHPIFQFSMPLECPGIPAAMLDPQGCWSDKQAYNKAAQKLKMQFDENLKLFTEKAVREVDATTKSSS